MASLVDFKRIFISSHLYGCAWRQRDSQGHLQRSINQKPHYHFKAGLCWWRPEWHRSPMEDETACRDRSRKSPTSVIFPPFVLYRPPAPFTVLHLFAVIYLVRPSLSLPILLPSISSPLHLICTFSTWLPGWQALYEISFWVPRPSWRNFSILQLIKGLGTGGPDELQAVVMSLQGSFMWRSSRWLGGCC